MPKWGSGGDLKKKKTYISVCIGCDTHKFVISWMLMFLQLIRLTGSTTDSASEVDRELITLVNQLTADTPFH